VDLLEGMYNWLVSTAEHEKGDKLAESGERESAESAELAEWGELESVKRELPTALEESAAVASSGNPR
jgi:hypothetical protein